MENSHKLILNDRNTLELTGVKDVENYNEQEIVLLTSFGNLTIYGYDFNIIKLDVETGEMKITGQIDSVYYTDKNEKSTSILKRLFK